jgi:glycosidase
MVPEKPVVYQLVVRLFGNARLDGKDDGTLAENGVGKFADIDERALSQLRSFGVTHVWLTGVLRQATLTDYAPLGMPADAPAVVKGRAGSFYAVRDYYDVCPDYAVEPRNRLAEFRALVARMHDARLRVLIDLVPNHVARGYGSVVHPERDFGRDDDRTKFFDPGNDFFYLVQPPGQALSLERPLHWQPEGVDFEPRYAPEDGSAGRVPKVTGNRVAAPAPSATDWYETILVNWGHDFTTGRTAFDPIPSAWTKFDDIVAYWQGLGVDGFRADFAHWIPDAAWRFLLDRARARNPRTMFVAEAYDNLDGLIACGFDAVYHDEAYDTLKRVVLGQNDLGHLDAVLGSLPDAVRARRVHYLENHDERRIASALVAGDDAASGFGSARAGVLLAPLLYLYGRGPVLLYNGQEVGETGAGAKGFGRDEGRTSIFDYGTMPELSKWVNGHRYDGGLLSPEQEALRRFYGDLLALCQAPEIRADGYWGLRYACDHTSVFPYARFASGGATLVLVAANFDARARAAGRIRVPEELARAAGLAADERLIVLLLLDERGKNEQFVAETTTSALASRGLAFNVAARATYVFRIGPATP